MTEADIRGAETLRKIQSAQSRSNEDYRKPLRYPWSLIGVHQAKLPEYLGARGDLWCGETCKKARECVRDCERKAVEMALRYRVLRDSDTSRVEEASVSPEHNQWQSVLVCGREVWASREDVNMGQGDVRVSWSPRGIEVTRFRYKQFDNNKATDFALLTTLLSLVDFTRPGAVLGTWDTDTGAVFRRVESPTKDSEEFDKYIEDFEFTDDISGILHKAGEDLSTLFPTGWLAKESVVLTVESEWTGASDHDELDGQHLRRIVSVIFVNQYGGDIWGRLLQGMDKLATCVCKMQTENVSIEWREPLSSTCYFLVGGGEVAGHVQIGHGRQASSRGHIRHGEALASVLAIRRVVELGTTAWVDGKVLERSDFYAWHLPDRVTGAVDELREQVAHSRQVTGQWAVLVCEDSKGHEDCRAILLPGEDLAIKYSLGGPAQCAVILDLADNTSANATFVGKRNATGDVVLPNDGSVKDNLRDYWRSGRFRSSSPRGDWFDWIHDASGSECLLAIVIILVATTGMLVADSGVFHFIAAFFLGGTCRRESHLVTLWSACRAVFTRDTRRVGYDRYGHTSLLVSLAMVEILHELEWDIAASFGVVVGAWWIVGWSCTVIMVCRRDDEGNCMIMRPLTGGPWGVTEARPLLFRESDWAGYFGKKGCRCTEVDNVQITPYGLGISGGSTVAGRVGHCVTPMKWADTSKVVLCAGLSENLTN